MSLLSDAEGRGALLAARGFSNRDISQQLFITVSTVEQHLTRVHRKLGVSGRRALPELLPSPGCGPSGGRARATSTAITASVPGRALGGSTHGGLASPVTTSSRRAASSARRRDGSGVTAGPGLAGAALSAALCQEASRSTAPLDAGRSTVTVNGLRVGPPVPAGHGPVRRAGAGRPGARRPGRAAV
ncbi:helix-turn-helix domain-containing protein [Streptomyces akebiae]|uniref:Helix-turn-helix transcriptional regulator n=1 Tax=Streptomyces akebiae TaxID=2865673 RepID=A0ABX8Y628_9ACTN|nr:helix-turn-helix transcriptional regulator [Streptomyces akebiae]